MVWYRPARPPRGFSLLEVLWGLSLLLVLAAATAPSVAALRGHARLYAAAQQLAADLSGARFRAVVERRRVSVILEPEAGSYRIIAGAAGAEASLSPEQKAELPPGVQIDSVTAPGHVIAFRAGGHAVPFGTVTLRRGAEKRSIVVSLAGRVRIQ